MNETYCTAVKGQVQLSIDCTLKIAKTLAPKNRTMKLDLNKLLNECILHPDRYKIIE